MSDIKAFQALYPNLNLIPAEILPAYYISNDADAWQLHRLYEILGLEIIAKSALRQIERWPGQPLFISTLRKRYKRRIPRDFYHPRLQEWGVYILVTLDQSIVKIGMSSNVLHRAFTLSGNNPYQTRTADIRFDLENSHLIIGFETRSAAIAVENKIKQRTIEISVPPPSWAPYQSGKTEWRSYSPDMIDNFRRIAENVATLRILKLSSISAKISMLVLLA